MPSKILIFQQRGWGIKIGIPLAKRLHNMGVILSAITFKPGTHTAILNQPGVQYTDILSHDALLTDPYGVAGISNITLQEICDELEIDSLWPYFANMRNFVRNYQKKYYYDFKKNVSDEFMHAYIKACYIAFKDILKKAKPDVVIAPNRVAFPHILMDFLCKKHKIPFLTVEDTKVTGIYAFSEDTYFQTGRMIRRLEELNKGIGQSKNEDKAKEYIASFRKEYQKPSYMRNTKQHVSLINKIRQEAGIWRKAFYYLRHPSPSPAGFGKIQDAPGAYYILRDYYTHKRNKKNANQYAYDAVPADKSYAYLPLQFQPEATIDVICPYFNNQIETARLIAQSLPGDMTLVVKEHPAMIGRRAKSYYQKIQGCPNIRLIDYRIPGEKIMKEASLIISQSGTTLYECAFFHKPAIQLGELGTVMRLPNVKHHTDLTTLSHAIKDMLSKDLQTEEYETHLINYVAAAYDTGFDLDFIGIWERPCSDNDINALVEQYVRELKHYISFTS